jgi:hypothetical protein
MGPAEVRQFCEVDPSAALRAGPAGSETIQTQHLAEAIQYRPRRQFQKPPTSRTLDCIRPVRHQPSGPSTDLGKFDHGCDLDELVE